MELTDTDFAEYKMHYIDEAYEKVYQCDGDLFNLIHEMLDPESRDFKEARMIVAGLACHGILAYKKKQHALDDEIAEFEESDQVAMWVERELENMWDRGDYFEEFFEPPFE